MGLACSVHSVNGRFHPSSASMPFSFLISEVGLIMLVPSGLEFHASGKLVVNMSLSPFLSAFPSDSDQESHLTF